MADLNGEDVRGEQFGKTVAEVVAQSKGLIGVGFCHDPFEADRRVQNAPHAWSRSSRMAGTPMSRIPCFSRTASRIRSIRSQARRIASGSRMPDRARRAASSSSAMTSGGMLPCFCEVVIKLLLQEPRPGQYRRQGARCHALGTPKHAFDTKA